MLAWQSTIHLFGTAYEVSLDVTWLLGMRAGEIDRLGLKRRSGWLKLPKRDQNKTGEVR
jgi:hypothetical protein